MPRRMIYGIGTDICDIRRIEATFGRQGERFVRKVLSDAEIAVWQSAQRAQRPAGCALSWPPAFPPRKPSPKPSAWACACP